MLGWFPEEPYHALIHAPLTRCQSPGVLRNVWNSFRSESFTRPVFQKVKGGYKWIWGGHDWDLGPNYLGVSQFSSKWPPLPCDGPWSWFSPHGPPYSPSAEIHHSKSKSCQDSGHPGPWRAQHHFCRVVLVKDRPRPGQIRGEDTDFVSPAHRGELLPAILGDSLPHSFPPPRVARFSPSSQTLQCVCLNLFNVSDMNCLLLMSLAWVQPLTSLHDPPCILELISVLPIFLVWWCNLWPHNNAARTQLLC